MGLPELIRYETESGGKDIDRYRNHFEGLYCNQPIITFDGIVVRFRKTDFDHCFFESSRRRIKNKDQFSDLRSERIDWIKYALESRDSDLFEGWDNTRKRYDSSRRVCLVQGNYIVVIRLTGKSKAQFVTAYVADSAYTLLKIKQSPVWVA